VHQKSLQDLATDLGVASPFEHYENTRFGANSQAKGQTDHE
jgi:hypothetical protein